MDKKIIITDLAQTLADKMQLTHKEADDFVRAFFDTISKQVVADGLVKVKGLGTFKMIEVLNRESVDVNTGERIIIPGHTKVSFTPDAALKDRVNKPFADFKTVIINEGTNLEDMERMDDEIPAPVVEMPSEPAVQEEPVVEEPVEEVAPIVEEPAPIVEEPAPVEEAPAQFAEEAPAPIAEEKVPVVEQVVIPEDPEPEKKEETPAEPVVANPYAPVQPAEETPEPVKETPAAAAEIPAPSVTPAPVQPEPVAQPTVQEVINEIKKERKQCSLMCKMFVTLVVLILLVLSYLAGYYRWFDAALDKFNTPAKTEQPAAPLKPSIQKKTVAAANKKKAVAPVDSSKFFTQVPRSKYLIVGHWKKHTISLGEYLMKIARKEYHDNDAYECIIAFNKFDDPSTVHVGTVIDLPKLKLKEEQTDSIK